MNQIPAENVAQLLYHLRPNGSQLPRRQLASSSPSAVRTETVTRTRRSVQGLDYLRSYFHESQQKIKTRDSKTVFPKGKEGERAWGLETEP